MNDVNIHRHNSWSYSVHNGTSPKMILSLLTPFDGNVFRLGRKFYVQLLLCKKSVIEMPIVLTAFLKSTNSGATIMMDANQTDATSNAQKPPRGSDVLTASWRRCRAGRPCSGSSCSVGYGTVAPTAPGHSPPRAQISACRSSRRSRSAVRTCFWPRLPAFGGRDGPTH